MKALLAQPSSWRLLSSVALVVFVVALFVGGAIPLWGWIALILSGLAFVVELVLQRRGGER